MTFFEDSDLKPSILVVEDEEAIVAMLKYNLEKEGIRVRSTDNGDEVFMMIEEAKPDLILLDWMLPAISGIEILEILRRKPESKNIPVIMLSAKGEEMDRISGLEHGADDYLVKPFSPAELLARIKAVFRRIRPAFTTEKLEFGGVMIDLSARQISYNGQEIHVGPTEFRTLQCLMEHPTRVLSREQLMRKVWGYDTEIEPRTVDVHINRLRKALTGCGAPSNVIKTIRSAGYCLQEPQDS